VYDVVPARTSIRRTPGGSARNERKAKYRMRRARGTWPAYMGGPASCASVVKSSIADDWGLVSVVVSFVIVRRRSGAAVNWSVEHVADADDSG
jgi:hypothetical protein